MVQEAYKSDIMWKRNLDIAKKMEGKNLGAEAAMKNISALIPSLTTIVYEYIVPDSELWLFDQFLTGDIAPTVFKGEISIDDDIFLAETDLIVMNSVMKVPDVLMSVRNVKIIIENTTILNQQFEMMLIYTKYSKKYLSTLLGELGINVPGRIRQ